MAESQGRWMDPNRREYTVKIALQNVGDGVRLKPAMRCEATITLGRVENVVAVPLQAVFTDEMVRFVYVPRDGRYARVPVKIGRRSDTLAEIAAGLSPGERVLVREPSPGEVLREAWDAAALKLVGLEIGEDGKPLPIGGGHRGGPGWAGAGRSRSGWARGPRARGRASQSARTPGGQPPGGGASAGEQARRDEARRDDRRDDDHDHRHQIVSAQPVARSSSLAAPLKSALPARRRSNWPGVEG
jgi:hypothetical protein